MPKPGALADILAVKLHHLRLHLSLLNRIRRRAPHRLGKAAPPMTKASAQTFAVLGIFKNESHLIEEWLDHYLTQEAAGIFLIDNGSTDDSLAKIARFASSGRVEVVSLPEPQRQQQHYWTAFRHFRIAERFDWLAIADIDEFWFCKSGETLARYLGHQTAIDGLYAHWTNFGSSGHERQPASVRRSLLACDPRLGPQTKCIFRTSLPQQENDIEVHHIRNLSSWRARIANRDLQLNHYVCQSRDYWFGVKMTRGDVFYGGVDTAGLAARFDRVNAASTRTCPTLRNLLEKGFVGR